MRWFKIINEADPFAGRTLMLFWGHEKVLADEPQAVIRGTKALGRREVCMNRTASLAPTCYFGEMFDRNGAVAILRENGHLGALWCLVSSDECALEVKNSTQVRLEDLRGLKNFGEDFPESRRWLLHRGRERLLRDGILCAPCEEFLLQLKPGEFPA